MKNRRREAVVVRPAKFSDENAIAALIEASCDVFRSGMRMKLGKALYERIYGENPRDLTPRFLNGCGYTPFVAERTGRVVGFICVDYPGCVVSLCVDKDFRREGIGTALIEAAGELKTLLYADAPGYVFGAVARAFYQSLGMKAVPFVRFIKETK